MPHRAKDPEDHADDDEDDPDGEQDRDAGQPADYQQDDSKDDQDDSLRFPLPLDMPHLPSALTGLGFGLRRSHQGEAKGSAAATLHL